MTSNQPPASTSDNARVVPDTATNSPHVSQSEKDSQGASVYIQAEEQAQFSTLRRLSDPVYSRFELMDAVQKAKAVAERDLFRVQLQCLRSDLYRVFQEYHARHGECQVTAEIRTAEVALLHALDSLI